VQEEKQNEINLEMILNDLLLLLFFLIFFFFLAIFQKWCVLGIQTTFKVCTLSVRRSLFVAVCVAVAVADCLNAILSVCFLVQWHIARGETTTQLFGEGKVAISDF
jgi:hypothetical protein